MAAALVTPLETPPLTLPESAGATGYAATMDDGARTLYRSIAIAFLVLGGAVIMVGLLEDLIGFTFFRGDPSWVGLFLAAIGALLYWTVRDPDPE